MLFFSLSLYLFIMTVEYFRYNITTLRTNNPQLVFRTNIVGLLLPLIQFMLYILLHAVSMQ
jgi:hypothetical protein